MFEGYIASQISKDEMPRIERRAADRFRFRNIRSRESRILSAVVTSVLGFLTASSRVERGAREDACLRAGPLPSYCTITAG